MSPADIDQLGFNESDVVPNELLVVWQLKGTDVGLRFYLRLGPLSSPTVLPLNHK